MRIASKLSVCFTLVAASLLAATPAARAADAPPLATFFANAEISAARLSPSGKYLALTVASKSGRTVLATLDADAPATSILVVAGSERADVRSFEWVNDESLVYNVVDSFSPGQDQNFGPGLFSVKRDGSEGRLLIRVRWDAFETGTRITPTQLNPDHGLLDVPESGGADVIVGQYRFDNLGNLTSITPKRLNVASGRATAAVIGYPQGTNDWVFDRTGEPRVAVALQNGVVEVFWRDMASNTWRSLVKAPEFKMPWRPYAVDGDGRLYVTVPGPDSAAVLKRFDFATGAPEAAPIVSTPGFDFQGSLLFENEGRKLIGVRVDTDAATTVWLDPEHKKLQEIADARFPGRINVVRSRGNTTLVYSYSDRDPGAYYLYRQSSASWVDIGSRRPKVDPRQMAALDLHRAKARDGLDLPVWVTSPRGKTSAPRAAVVLIHGGPWVRGVHWEWSGEAQFLASRGYVVIEPEYRGSTGYGDRHFRAGWKNWGTTMQDDIADAVAWAGKQGLIDTKRVCIAGASYGGYATLMSAVRYPDLYRCGVAWVAVSDPRLLFEESWLNDADREEQRFSMPMMIGDPVKDADLLKAAAPVERAAEIKIPLLMAFGSNDRRVPLAHGSRMRAALKAAGNDPEYVVYDGEGHGWLKVENRIDFWTRVEKFLAKNLN